MKVHIEEQIVLAPFTTMRVGGPARFFARVQSEHEMREVMSFARIQNVPLLVLGGGSNILFLDKGFSGLVIKNEYAGIVFQNSKQGNVCVVVGAGEVWDHVVQSVVARGLWGIENLSLVPGTMGGAVVQNIGAYGVELNENILWVEAYDMQTQETKTFLRSECAFGYRTSIFKTNPHLIVTRAALELTDVEKKRIEYEDVRQYFLTKKNNTPSLQDIRSAIVAIRTAKMPASFVGSAGSFFKNPVVSSREFKRLQGMYPEIKAYIQRDMTAKLSAAWLLDKVCGWRGVRHGNVGVHEKQSLVIVNYGNASTQEILNFTEDIKKDFKKKTNVTLEEEVVIVQ